VFCEYNNGWDIDMNRLRRKILIQVIIGIVGIFVTFIGWKIIGACIYGKLTEENFAILNIFATVSLTVVPLLIMLLGKDDFSDYGITRREFGKQIKVGISIALCMTCVFVLLSMLLGLQHLVYGGEGYQSIESALGGLAYFLLVVGLVEEFVFRGFLYGKLKEICLSDVAPIFISSVLFGVLHFSGLNFTQVIVASAMGAVYCWCMEHIPNCSLLSLIIAHGTHDWLIRVLASIF
jgi:membrane protease YdiL (CAAX protease family)